MSKAVLMSIQPKWCELIVSRDKTVELRKSKPKLDVPFKVYIYCTQGKLKDIGIIGNEMYLNRMKVIGEFVCDNILEIGFSPYNHGEYLCHDQTYIEQSCVPFEEMFDYLGEIYGYGWHISDLVIYDEPKKLQEFNLGRPPQSWCCVEGV